MVVGSQRIRAELYTICSTDKTLQMLGAKRYIVIDTTFNNATAL